MEIRVVKQEGLGLTVILFEPKTGALRKVQSDAAGRVDLAKVRKAVDEIKGLEPGQEGS